MRFLQLLLAGAQQLLNSTSKKVPIVSRNSMCVPDRTKSSTDPRAQSMLFSCIQMQEFVVLLLFSLFCPLVLLGVRQLPKIN